MRESRTVVLAIIVAVTINVYAVSSDGEKWKRLDGQCGDHLTFVFSNGILTIEGTGPMWDFSYVVRCPWNNIYNSIETIIIKEGVTSVGAEAFGYLPRLKTVTLPNSVTSIGEYAFEMNSGLENITIPESVVTIGGSAFADCDSLTSIFVDERNSQFKSIDGVLYSIGGDVIVQFPKGKSKSFTIPANVKTIAAGAFGGCTFSTITIPDSVTSIGAHAFWACRSLTHIILPNSITSIGEGAFYLCKTLADITLRDGIKTIPNDAFYWCSSLAQISIPDSVTSIGDGAFSYCEALESIIIPDTVRWIGGSAFYGCKTLTHVTLPQGIPSIEEDTFYECTSLMNITIPDTVMSIGPHAFSGCKSLTNVFIPSSVTVIEIAAFSGCVRLEDIKIPDSVTSIESYAFSDSGLVNVTIPESVTSIEGDTFRRCQNLYTVFYLGSNCIQQSLFSYSGNLTNICVSPDYNCTQFGGVNITSSNQICHEFQTMFNQCFKASYVDGVLVQDKKLSAIEWEKQSNGCMEYQCINETGLAAWSVCNSTADVNQFCINDQCVENKESVENKKAYVEIEIEDGAKVVDMNAEYILGVISIHFGVDSNELVIGYENDEQGNLVRIMIYVNEEQTANVIAEGLKDLKEGGGCGNDKVLCRTRSIQVTVIMMEQSLSGAPKLQLSLAQLFVLFSFLFYLCLLK